MSATSTITSAANITGGNILTAGLMSSTGNGIHGNVLTAGVVSATANITTSAYVKMANSANAAGPGAQMTYNTTQQSIDFTFG